MSKVYFISMFLGLLLFPVFMQAQSVNYTPPPHSMPDDLPMHHILYVLDRMVTTKKMSDQKIAEWIGQKEFRLRENGRINVEIINRQGDNPLPADIVRQFDGEMGMVWRNRVSAWVFPGQLVRLARALPEGFFMEKANVPMPDDEGPAVTGSDEYRDNGADGSGINIGIIDIGFQSYSNAIDSGHVPANYTEVNLTDDNFETGGLHGTRCVENVYDHAPGASYFLYKIGNLTHLGSAVDHAIENNVNILSHSLSWYNTGWEDNTGDACEAAQNASINNILFFTSAGNRAQQHWQGDFLDSDDDDWHDFGPNDELIQIRIPAWGTAYFRLCWNTEGGTYNYDLFLFDEFGTSALDSSVNTGNIYEELNYTNNSMNEETVQLAVYRRSGGSTEFEIFQPGNGIWDEHFVSENSTTSPSNCTYSQVISVAAVDQSDFTSVAGTMDINMDYSSQGPTNSGNPAPGTTGPTNTTITKNGPYGGVFGGTSCATPNAAGLAATFWSSAPYLSAEGVRWLLFRQATIFKDWGEPGRDYIYGYGGIQLHSFHENTVWVDRNVGNVNGYSTIPYYYVSDAQDAVNSPGRIVFLGDSYPEPISLEKADVRYESIGSRAVLGE